MEFILEMLFELLLQAVGELLFELGWRASLEVFEQRRYRNPLLAGFGSLFFGLCAGALSLIFVPHHFITSDTLRMLNLLVTPLLVGLLMWTIGRWRIKRDKDTIRLESFWHGFIFALGMGLFRFFLAKNN